MLTLVTAPPEVLHHIPPPLDCDILFFILELIISRFPRSETAIAPPYEFAATLPSKSTLSRLT